MMLGAWLEGLSSGCQGIAGMLLPALSALVRNEFASHVLRVVTNQLLPGRRLAPAKEDTHERDQQHFLARGH
jgi:hypothetical protein